MIPYAVGVDIACRMRLSLYEVSPYLLGQKRGMFEDALQEQTAFGMGAQWKGSQRADHKVLDDPAWNATPLLSSRKDNPVRQLGTSVTGNHFVEWGSFRLYEPLYGLQPGEYLALLSHSGSRSVGFKIADATASWPWRSTPALIRASVTWHGSPWILRRVRTTGSRWSWPS